MKIFGRIVNMYFCPYQNIDWLCRPIYKLINITRSHSQSISRYQSTEGYLLPCVNSVVVNCYNYLVKHLCMVCLLLYECIFPVKIRWSEKSSRVSVIATLSLHLSVKSSIENFAKCLVKRYGP
jgi:hypothetical protein